MDDDAFIASATTVPTILIMRVMSSGPKAIVLDELDPTCDTDRPGSSSWASIMLGLDVVLTDDRACWYVRPAGNRKRWLDLP